MSKGVITYRRQLPTWLVKAAKYVIILFVLVGCTHRFIANDDPLIASYDGHITSPITLELLSDLSLVNHRHFDSIKYEWAVYPMIPYTSHNINSTTNVNVSPLSAQDVSSWRYRHWLGTDHLGRDVLSGLLSGTSIALQVGVFSILIALMFGIYFGIIAGYYGDDNWKLNPYQLISSLIVKLLGLYYIIYPIVLNAGFMYYLIVISIVVLLLWVIDKYMRRWSNRKVSIPTDIALTKIIEVLNSIPGLFLILALLSVFSTPSIWNVIIIIALLRWTVFARHTRAEVLQIRNLAYLQSAQSLGLSDLSIIKHHVLPNILTPLISIIAFAVSGAILTESTLSFIGLGIPLEQVSWGSMLSDARDSYDAWWLALFPGLAIFMVLMALYIIGSDLQQKLNFK